MHIEKRRGDRDSCAFHGLHQPLDITLLSSTAVNRDSNTRLDYSEGEQGDIDSEYNIHSRNLLSRSFGLFVVAPRDHNKYSVTLSFVGVTHLQPR